MLNKILSYIPAPVITFTGVFLVIWLYGWHMNANGTHYDLNSLKDVYVWIGTQLNVFHGINSGLNSKLGESIK